ncbi:hypothetical protein [Microvirga mediterraneensis]|uniref:Uncharacterized protein n=1 Tax=Microvirga mediterraneensis TaxID=2754695 RepID=A0A838BNN5_9HYPH|nr:hypothetical protein [Microvirga mediterraneensis]MBA1156679.1 hypothetical protein [Microvirga mediterraneensis]
MRRSVSLSAILLAGLVLSGCIASTGPVGVLPRDPVPPPPSISGSSQRSSAAAPRTSSTSPRRGLSVPGQVPAPRP